MIPTEKPIFGIYIVGELSLSDISLLRHMAAAVTLTGLKGHLMKISGAKKIPDFLGSLDQMIEEMDIQSLFHHDFYNCLKMAAERAEPTSLLNIIPAYHKFLLAVTESPAIDLKENEIWANSVHNQLAMTVDEYDKAKGRIKKALLEAKYIPDQDEPMATMPTPNLPA